METYPLKRWAKVIDNVDPDELGRVQVRILPELNGIADDADLPWALPESNSRTGTSPGVGRHSIPDIDSHISVLIVDKYWKLIYYKEIIKKLNNKNYHENRRCRRKNDNIF